MAIQNLSNEAIQKILQIIVQETGLKLDKALKGAANGLAELDATGKVPAAQLPSYVDDVIEGYLSGGKLYKESAHTTEIAGEAGKIYVDLTTSKTYRWSGTAFVVISDTIALGETASTAFRGDHGKAAYDHSQKTSGNPHNVTKSDVGLGNVENKSVADILGEMTAENITEALGFTPTGLPSGGTAGQVLKKDANGGFTWSADNDTKYSAMKGATASAAGSTGLVPPPEAGATGKYLRGDGTWVTPPNTTYTTGNTSTAGITKLYGATGTATDGAMTQAATKTELDKKVNTTDVTEITAADIETMYATIKGAQA